jgi:hypothetical protein
MKIRLLALAVLSCAVSFGQTTENSIVKVVRVRGDAQEIAALVGPGTPVSARASRELKAIVVRGKPADVESVERSIQELDALGSASPSSAKKDIETTFYVFAGSAEPLANISETTSEVLKPVVKQLRAIFPYSHYQLLSTMLIRSAQDGHGNTEGAFRAPGKGPDATDPSRYALWYESAGITPGTTASVHLKKLHFSARIPYPRERDSGGKTQFGFVDASIDTDVDLLEGQQVVVGKANVSNPDICLFLVLSARLAP